MSRAPLRPVILLVEDSEDDEFFFRWTLQKAGIDCELIHVCNGEEARRYLSRCAGQEAAERPPRPDLVFLDLKMPALTGFELLEWLRQHSFDPALEIAVLSGSEHASDVARAHSLGAAAYYTKPISPEHLRNRIAAWQYAAGASSATCRAVPA